MTLAAPKSSDSTPAAAASSPGQCNDTRVAYLGPVGTYSHEVTQQRFPGSEYTLTPYPTIHDAVHALLPEQQDQEQEGGSSTVASWAVVPLENSSFGPVLETHQVLVEPAVVRYTRTLHERIRFNVRHCLIAYAPPVTHPHLLPPSSPPTVRTIYSHPQALGQCREYIAQHYPEVDTVATASTAEAASLVAADPSRQSLAIGSPACIRYFPLLVVLQFDIQDAGQDNFTTFIVIQRKD